MVTCSKLPSEDGSVISNESEKLNSSRSLTVLKVTAQQKPTKEETCKRDGESCTLMKILIIYFTDSLHTRSGVSQKSPPTLFARSPAPVSVSHADRYPEKNALQLFFTAGKVATQQ